MELTKLGKVDSTNDYLKRHCKELPSGTVVTAEVQTSGRGRRGHIWEGNSGMLPMSILLKNPPETDTLTPRVGLAVCEALEDLAKSAGFSLSAQIKWVNDIIVANHKVCGILCESVFFGDSVNVICGIGLNISQSEDFFEKAGLPNGGSLKMLTGFEPNRDDLAKAISERVISRGAVPFSACRDEYKRRVINLGKEVRLIGKEERRAVAVDIAENGFLICKDESGEFAVSSGEVSVRGIEGYL